MTLDTPPSTASWFPATSWTLVLASGEDGLALNREHLNRLCQAYWRPVFWHIHLHWKKPREDAYDLTQAFFAWLLEQDLVADADPNRGRFRSFLKASLNNFLRNQERSEKALKRGGGVITVSLHQLEEEPPGGEEEGNFDRLFAASLLEQAVRLLKDRCQIEGKVSSFAAFEDYYLGAEATTHAAIAQSLGESESSVRRHLAWSLQVFAGLLRSRLSETLRDSNDLDGEMRNLFEGHFS